MQCKVKRKVIRSCVQNFELAEGSSGPRGPYPSVLFGGERFGVPVTDLGGRPDSGIVGEVGDSVLLRFTWLPGEPDLAKGEYPFPDITGSCVEDPSLS